MKSFPRVLLQSLSLFLLASLLLLALSIPLPTALAQDPSPGGEQEANAPAGQGETPPPQYTNDETFEQLSGAARTLLELKYGKKEAVVAAGENGKDASPSPSELGSSSTIGPLTAIDNVLINDPGVDTTAQDTQSETALVIAGSTLVAAWNDSGSFISGDQKFTGYGRSTTGGNTWTDGGTLPTNAAGDSGDPVLAHHNASNTTYLSTLNFIGSGLRVFRSNNGAASWLAPVEGAPGFGGNDFLDKEWIAVDNFAGSGNGNAYLIFRNFRGGGGGSQLDAIYLTISTDGGLTFGPSGGSLIVSAGAGNVQGAFVAVGPDHSVYTFWLDQSAGANTPNIIKMRRSTNQGASFNPALTIATLNNTNMNGSLGLNGGVRSNSFVQAAVNPSSGHLYLVFNDNPVGSDQADVFFTMSTNNGANWSAPVRVNDDATASGQFFPAITVTPDGTRLAITFYDRQFDPADNAIDRSGVIGVISGGTVTFEPNFRMTPNSFPVVIGVDPVVNPTYMGDYDMMAADNNFFYHSWGDNRDQSLAVPSRNNANVRFGRFPVTGPGAILSLVSASLAPGCGNGNGLIETNECNKLNIVLKNVGSSTATGVSATLSTSTPEVTIPQSNSLYANIAPGALVTNTILFKFKTSPTFASGSNLSFTLSAATADDGSFTFPFQMPSSLGMPGTPVRVDNNTPLNIVDVSTVTSTLAVSGIVSPVAKLTVSLYLTHTFDADLDISLVGPDGTTVELTTNNGGGLNNYGSACSPDGNRTTFDDTAVTAITAGTAPFVGAFRPEGSLAAFNGKSGAAVNGIWSLRITDDAIGDIGRLQCWSLFISPVLSFDAGGAGCVDQIFLPIILK